MISPRSVGALPWIAILAAVSLAGPAFAQKIGQASDTDVSSWRVIGALVLCLALAAGAALALKTKIRGGAPILGPGARRLQLLETQRLSHQVDICLLKCDERHILIAATPHGAIVISGDHQPSSPTPSQ